MSGINKILPDHPERDGDRGAPRRFEQRDFAITSLGKIPGVGRGSLARKNEVWDGGR